MASGRSLEKMRSLFLLKYRINIITICLLATVLVLQGRTGYSEVLNLETMMTRAMQHSWDLKIAAADIEINRYRKTEVRSLYFPELSIRFYDEYVRVLDSDQDDVVSAGDTVLANDESTYQSTLIASLNYSLYDFGARDLKYENAARGIRIAELNAEQSRIDLQQTVLEHYTQGLMLQERITALHEILQYRKDVYRAYQSLRKAGTVRQTLVEESALNLADELSRLDDLEKDRLQLFKAIEFYTGEYYSPKITVLADLSTPSILETAPDVRLFPEIQAYQAEITRKEAEYRIARREMLPRLRLQGSYRFYGSDPSGVGAALEELEERDATVTLIAEWNLFSGFGDIAKQRRLQAEMERLVHEKNKRVSELEQNIQSAMDTFYLYEDNQKRWKSYEAEIQEHMVSARRLADQQMTDRIVYLEKKIQMVQQRLNIALKRIERASTGLRLQIWNGGTAK